MDHHRYRNAVSALPAHLRDILALALDDRPYDAIAATLGITVSAVEAGLADAIARLVEALDRGRDSDLDPGPDPGPDSS